MWYRLPVHTTASTAKVSAQPFARQVSRLVYEINSTNTGINSFGGLSQRNIQNHHQRKANGKGDGGDIGVFAIL